MSGGVDSAVAAKLLREAGHECVGCTMHLFDNDTAGLASGRTCCSLSDVEDARAVARSLGMPHYTFNFKDDFKEKIIDRFIAYYEAGKTPNPCIACNRYMKFEKLFERAAVLGCEAVATGHYARIAREGDRYVLKKALDPAKDQSYVLYTMTQQQLAHTLFPLGEWQKTDTRRAAAAGGFANAEKPDSQDICFVPDGDYAAFLARYTGKTPETGRFIDTAGNVLGEHQGIVNYTVGQHRWLGLTDGKKRYVVEVRAADNTVVLGEEKDLFFDTVFVDHCNWIAGEVPQGPLRCAAKLRYRQKEEPATAVPTAQGGVILRFDRPQRAPTKGQAAVLYEGDTVLGGGEIAGAEREGVRV